AQQEPRFTRADSLRGSITPERAWWDVTYYDLNVRVQPEDSTIHGWNGITYRVVSAPRDLQIDLMEPLAVDSIVQDSHRLDFRRDGNALLVTPRAPQRVGEEHTLRVHFGGRPIVATNAPWDGG